MPIVEFWDIKRSTYNLPDARDWFTLVELAQDDLVPMPDLDESLLPSFPSGCFREYRRHRLTAHRHDGQVEHLDVWLCEHQLPPILEGLIGSLVADRTRHLRIRLSQEEALSQLRQSYVAAMTPKLKAISRSRLYRLLRWLHLLPALD